MATARSYVLVEGKDDQHVIWALCARHQLPEAFSVETPKKDEESSEGIDAVLAGLPVRLKGENLRALGIVVDANESLSARWLALRNRLASSGYTGIPETPTTEGLVLTQPDLPKVGVWLMPDNHMPGMLEDFVARLIPPGDALKPKAEAILQEIEEVGLHRYTAAHRPKALIHTWLAWQERPGMPMGQAITVQALSHDSPTALAFVKWLKRLFEPATAPAG